MKENNKVVNTKQKVINIIGYVICAILIPILIINCTLLIKGLINKDEVPSFIGISPLIVLSGSMEEDFKAGSLIIIKTEEASKIKEGDIISYFDPSSKSNAVVTHKVRFIKTTENGEIIFYTYGTANVDKDFEDVTESDCEKIPESKLVGLYTGIHFDGLGNAAIFMQSTAGLIICVFVPLAALVSYEIIRRKKYENKHQNDKDELMRELEELRKLKAEKESASTSDEVVSQE